MSGGLNAFPFSAADQNARSPLSTESILRAQRSFVGLTDNGCRDLHAYWDRD